MAAPIGNKFWLARSRHGPKPKFSNPDDLWDACCQYFDWVAENPLEEEKIFSYQGEIIRTNVSKMRAMTIEGLINFLDISRPTWFDWRKREDLATVVAKVDNIIRQQKFEGAAAELLNPNIIARDLGLMEKVDSTSSDGTMTPKTGVSVDVSKMSTKALLELIAAADEAES